MLLDSAESTFADRAIFGFILLCVMPKIRNARRADHGSGSARSSDPNNHGRYEPGREQSDSSDDIPQMTDSRACLLQSTQSSQSRIMLRHTASGTGNGTPWPLVSPRHKIISTGPSPGRSARPSTRGRDPATAGRPCRVGGSHAAPQYGPAAGTGLGRRCDHSRPTVLSAALSKSLVLDILEKIARAAAEEPQRYPQLRPNHRPSVYIVDRLAGEPIIGSIACSLSGFFCPTTLIPTVSWLAYGPMAERPRGQLRLAVEGMEQRGPRPALPRDAAVRGPSSADRRKEIGVAIVGGGTAASGHERRSP